MGLYVEPGGNKYNAVKNYMPMKLTQHTLPGQTKPQPYITQDQTYTVDMVEHHVKTRYKTIKAPVHLSKM